MRISFQADTFGADQEGDVLSVGVSGSDQYLLFSRELDAASDDDCGPYMEYGDQMHGKYRWASRCRLSRHRLEIDLSEALSSLPGVTGFDVDLKLSDQEFVGLAASLGRLFEGERVLEVEHT